MKQALTGNGFYGIVQSVTGQIAVTPSDGVSAGESGKKGWENGKRNGIMTIFAENFSL